MEAKAKEFATKCHENINQKRKYTGEPYINHPASVVEIVRSVPNHTEAMLCAAWLHDTVEDTGVSLEEIQSEFGEEVATLVEMLTDVSKPSDGNRAKRKELDRLHIANASAEAKTIKLADLIDNTSSICEHDEDFAKIYLAEKLLLLEVLKEGNQTLWDIAYWIARVSLPTLNTPNQIMRNPRNLTYHQYQ